MRSIAVVFCLLAGVAAGPLLAQQQASEEEEPDTTRTREIRLTVPTGQELQVAHVTSARRDCTPGRAIPEVVIVTQPNSGQVVVNRDVMGMHARTNRCSGVQLRGVTVIYRPRSGFRGTDRLTYRSTFASGRAAETNVEISVR
jgi:hypothetical protein